MAVANSISHLRTYYALAGLSTWPWYHQRVGLAPQVVMNQSQSPLSPLQLPCSHSPEATCLTLLLMYMGFMQQNLVAPLTVRALCHEPGDLALKRGWGIQPLTSFYIKICSSYGNINGNNYDILVYFLGHLWLPW